MAARVSHYHCAGWVWVRGDKCTEAEVCAQSYLLAVLECCCRRMKRWRAGEFIAKLFCMRNVDSRVYYFRRKYCWPRLEPNERLQLLTPSAPTHASRCRSARWKTQNASGGVSCTCILLKIKLPKTMTGICDDRCSFTDEDPIDWLTMV